MSTRAEWIAVLCTVLCTVACLGILVLALLGALDDYGHPLLNAAYRGDVRTVDRLLREGIDVNTVGPYGHTALILAAYNPDTEIVAFLLEHGANVNAKDDAGMTPLHCAGYKGNVAVARLLLTGGADVALTNRHGFNPLHEAAMKGPNSLVEMLVRAGAPLAVADADGWHPLHRLLQAEWFAECTPAERVHLVKLFLDHGTDPLAANPGGWKKAHLSDSLKTGPRHIDRARGDTPIEIATSMGWREILELLQKVERLDSTRPSTGLCGPASARGR